MFPRRPLRASLATSAALGAGLLACGPSYSVSGEPLSPTTETLVAGPVDLAVPLSDGSILIDDGASLAIVTPGIADPTVIGRTGEIGSLLAYAELNGTTLIAGSAGTFVVQTGAGAGLFRAPIETAIGSDPIHALALTPRPEAASDLWVATADHLYVFRDDALHEVTLADVSLGNAELAPLGPGAVWAATAEDLVQLRIDPAAVMLRATRIDRPLGASSITVDADGTLWMIEGGEVSSLRRDLRLDRYTLPFAATRVFASRDANDVWFALENGTFQHQLHRIFRPVDGLSLEGALAGPEGTLYGRSAGGVVRVRSRHAITLEGLHAGPILEATRIEIRLPSAGSVTAVRARAGTVDLDVMGPIDDAATPPALVLEPGPIPVGSSMLTIEADYADGTLTASLSVPIEIATDATWTADIAPLYEMHCADCHGERGPSPTRLDSRQAWIDLSARIIDNVVTGRMPLGRASLPPSDIALIQAWASGGFTE